MVSMDAFNNDPFTMTALTAAVNEMPYVPTRTRELGLFETNSIASTTAFIDQKQGTVELIEATPRGSDPKHSTGDTRNAIPVSAVRLAELAVAYADEVQNVRAFGQETEMETLQNLLNQKQQKAVRDLDATLEYHRMGALKGKILDASGDTLLDLYNAFGISTPSNHSTGVAASNPKDGHIAKQVNALIRKIEDALGGADHGGVHAFVDSNLFDKIVEHPEIRDAYKYSDPVQVTGTRVVRRMVTYRGVTFEEYRGSVGGTQFVGTDSGIAFPVGVPGMYQQVFAPADRNETVNTLGMPRYAFPHRDPKDRFIEVEVQSNPITYCTRPQALIPLTT